MYSKLPNLVIGFHGCDETAYKKVLYNHDCLLKPPEHFSEHYNAFGASNRW